MQLAFVAQRGALSQSDFRSNAGLRLCVYLRDADYLPKWMEPELVIGIGSTRSLHGFPPWLLRIAEIGYGDKCSESTIVNQLQIYATSSQRCGT